MVIDAKRSKAKQSKAKTGVDVRAINDREKISIMERRIEEVEAELE